MTPLPATSPHATLTNAHVTCPQSSSQSRPFFSRSLIFTSGCFLRTTQDTALLPVPLALTFYLQLGSVAQSCLTVCDPMSFLFTTPKCRFTTRGLPPAWPFHPVCHPLSLPLSETSPRLSCAPPLHVCVCVCVCMCACVLNRLVMSDSFETPWAVAHQVPMSRGILQARILEWVTMPSSRGSSQPMDRTHVSHIAGGFFTN